MFLMWAVHGGCTEPPPPPLEDVAPRLEPYLPPAEPVVSVPVFGGTLEGVPAIDGLIAADPDGDRVVRIVGDEVVAIDLGDNARPFRIHVEDARAWVTL